MSCIYVIGIHSRLQVWNQTWRLGREDMVNIALFKSTMSTISSEIHQYPLNVKKWWQSFHFTKIGKNQSAVLAVVLVDWYVRMTLWRHNMETHYCLFLKESTGHRWITLIKGEFSRALTVYCGLPESNYEQTTSCHGTINRFGCAVCISTNGKWYVFIAVVLSVCKRKIGLTDCHVRYTFWVQDFLTGLFHPPQTRRGGMFAYSGCFLFVQYIGPV